MFLPTCPSSFVCLFVCLCARLLKNACMDWVEMLRVDGTSTNWLTSEPNPDHSPDAGTGQSENRWSVEVRQSPHSKQATGDMMQCREILFTPRCSPRAREFCESRWLSCRTYGCGDTGRQSYPIFGFWPIFPIQNQPTAYGLHHRMITIFPCGSQKRAMVSIGDL